MIWRMTALAEMVRVPKDAVVIMKMLVWASRQTVRRNRWPLTRAMRSISPACTRLGSGAGRGGRALRMAAMISSAPNGATFLDVTADPRMKPGDCILECELGVVDASLETQLKAIEHALLGKIRES